MINLLKKKSLISSLSLLLLFVLIISNFVISEEKALTEEDIYAMIIDFVLSRDPVIESQKQVMEAAFRLNELKIEEEMQIPAYVQSNIRMTEFESLARIQGAQQTYSQIKRALVTEVTQNITKMFALKNEIIFQTELRELLSDRLEGIERQVQVGIVDPDALIQLSEQLINIKTNIANNNNLLRFLKLEMAFNYGGDDWQELLKLLEKMEAIY